MSSRAQLETDVRALLAWFWGADRGLWPDEFAQLDVVRDHLDGDDTRPPERLHSANVSVVLGTKQGRVWGVHDRKRRAVGRLRPSGAQLVSYAGLLMGYVRNVTLRAGGDPDVAPEELRAVVDRLRVDVRHAKAVLALGGELS